MTIPYARPLAIDGDVPAITEPLDDEARLLAELRAGQPRAAERLAEATYGRLYAACHRLTGRADETADLVQETYRNAWRALPEVRGDARFSTWLFRIAWTTHAKMLRRPRLMASLQPDGDGGEPDHEPSPEANAATSERASRLRRAVATLPPELRYPIVALYWAELPIREIAISEGITPIGVRKRLARAFRLLATTLQENTR
jgi:RNA polymerase sigma-70 factor (ECF subfamily)